MNGIIMSNISQTQKPSSALLTVDFVVTTSKTNRKFEEIHYEMIKRKAEVKSRTKSQDKKEKTIKAAEKKDLKNHKAKPKLEKAAKIENSETKSKISNKIDKKV